MRIFSNSIIFLYGLLLISFSILAQVEPLGNGHAVVREINQSSRRAVNPKVIDLSENLRINAPTGGVTYPSNISIGDKNNTCISVARVYTFGNLSRVPSAH